MNYTVCDSALERHISRQLDADDRVLAYVKNDHLFCEIPYRFNGKSLRYRPDFLVRLAGDRMLLIEGKGRQTSKDDAKEGAAKRWVAAVNAAGQHEQPDLERPDWGVDADHCWDGWPGVVLEWPDFGVPTDDEAALAAVLDAIRRADAGEDVLVGCRGGIGRTGTILAAIAVAGGVPADGARAWVRQGLHPQAVETDDQVRWITEVVARDPRFGAPTE